MGNEAYQLREPLTETEADWLLDMKRQILEADEIGLFAIRRRLRNLLFRINQGVEQDTFGLSKIIEGQLEGRLALEHFTFDWDLSPTDPLKAILPFDWTAEGGEYDTLREMCDDGIVRSRRVCRPTAFTKQG